jgi:NAD(P)-dependent dehydrogenase (short-subunit alcohol dehydrogenase family)
MKTILVTGANRGIGLEICRQLDSLGYTVILCSRNLSKGMEAAKLISDRVKVSQLDVTNEESITTLFEKIRDDHGKLDVLINNAGIGIRLEEADHKMLTGVKNIIEKKLKGVWGVAKNFTPALRKVGIIPQKKSASDVPLTIVDNIMLTNVFGPWRMIQVFLPLLMKSSEGRIINISSGLGELRNLTGEYPGYSFSKASLNALTIMFAFELNAKGIRVNAMCPGWVKTDMGGPGAPRTVGQGADTAVWLATANDIPTGKFFRDRSEINW